MGTSHLGVDGSRRRVGLSEGLKDSGSVLLYRTKDTLFPEKVVVSTPRTTSGTWSGPPGERYR